MHGWPDTVRLWDDTIADLDKSNVLIANISYHADQ